MKIKIINPLVIKNKREQILNIKKNWENIKTEFLKECFEYFVERANGYLENEEIGDFVKWHIERGWKFKLMPYGMKIFNDYTKATFVEVGVGEVGENRPHPTVDSFGNKYEYNVPSIHKHAGNIHSNPNTWRFYLNDISEVDLKSGDYEEYETDSGRVKIITTGSQGSLFAYNAFQDLKQEHKKIWERVKARYF
jgi:hypothetical protein